jgi:hypothetical protein
VTSVSRSPRTMARAAMPSPANWVQIDVDAAAKEVDHLIGAEERFQLMMMQQQQPEVTIATFDKEAPMKRMTLAAIASICLAKSVTAQNVSDREAYEIARDAYVYAYPAMLMDVFMRQGTNYAEVLSVPATDRYFMLPLLSPWTDVFAVPGRRTMAGRVYRSCLHHAAGRHRGHASAPEAIGRAAAHALLILDKVGWHTTRKLSPLSNLMRGPTHAVKTIKRLSR